MERSYNLKKRRNMPRRNKFSQENSIFPTTKRARYLDGVDGVDFKDQELLKKFMTEQGKILPRRVTGTSLKQQRKLKKAIKRARNIGLVS
jgi:ribosomal protein S18